MVTTPPSFMAHAPHVGPLPRLVTPAPVRFTLTNGLEILAFPRHTAPTVSLSCVVRHGADSDPPGKGGLASLTAEMMDEGAGTHTAIALAEALERLGADLWLGAGRDGSQLVLQVPKNTFQPALALAGDVLLRPRFTNEDWERVKHDRQTALVQRRDQAESVANLATAATLFGDHHPYGRSVDGLPSDVDAISLQDVQAFYAAVWRPNASILVAAGDFDVTELRTWLQSTFGEWQPGPSPAPWSPGALPARPRLTLVDRPDAPQSAIRVFGIGTHRRSEDRAGLSMLEVILGGTFTSRLNFTLREKKGFTYGAGAGFSFYRYPGAFVARSSVFTQNTAEAVATFLDEIGGLQTQRISAEELTKAQATLLDRTAESLSTASGIVATFSDTGLYGLSTDEPARFIAEVETIGVDSLTALAARYLDPDRLSIVVVGPVSTIAASLEPLGFGPATVRNSDGRPGRQ